MIEYAIAHVDRPGPGVYSPRGAVKDLWQSHDFEVMVAGPAETGKTWGCCEYVHALAMKYPGSQHVIARKTYNDLVGSVVRTWQKITGALPGAKGPVTVFGGERPIWYDYFNGSRVWVAGLDNPGKALSSERDTIYVNQAEELRPGDWEVLTTRVTGRGAVMPFTRIFGDCNPGPPSHWIKRRHTLRLINSRHEDNPTLFDERGNILPQGKKTLAILDNLTGARKQRLRYGRWVHAEGVVYEEWGDHNLIDAMPKGWERWRKFRSIDFGFNNPFVCQWWAVDHDGRLYLYREMYMSNRIVLHHARGIADEDDATRIKHPGIIYYSQGEKYETTVADHDKEDRETLHHCGIPTAPAYKDVERGVQLVKARLVKSGDGKPRLFILRGCTVEIDPLLDEKKLPLKTVDEFDSYVMAKPTKGSALNDRNPKEEPLEKDNHGMDAMRYAVCYEDVQAHGGIVISDDVALFKADDRGYSGGGNGGGVEVF